MLRQNCTSLPGRALHTLIGYIDRSTALQVLVDLATIAITGALMEANAPRVWARIAAEYEVLGRAQSHVRRGKPALVARQDVAARGSSESRANGGVDFFVAPC